MVVAALGPGEAAQQAREGRRQCECKEYHQILKDKTTTTQTR